MHAAYSQGFGVATNGLSACVRALACMFFSVCVLLCCTFGLAAMSLYVGLQKYVRVHSLPLARLRNRRHYRTRHDRNDVQVPPSPQQRACHDRPSPSPSQAASKLVRNAASRACRETAAAKAGAKSVHRRRGVTPRNGHHSRHHCVGPPSACHASRVGQPN
jgi:hypothetical protein